MDARLPEGRGGLLCSKLRLPLLLNGRGIDGSAQGLLLTRFSGLFVRGKALVHGDSLGGLGM
jgi:hypothetical protein